MAPPGYGRFLNRLSQVRFLPRALISVVQALLLARWGEEEEDGGTWLRPEGCLTNAAGSRRGVVVSRCSDSASIALPMAESWTAQGHIPRRVARVWRPVVAIAVLALLVAQGFMLLQLRRDFRSQDAALANQARQLSSVKNSLRSVSAEVMSASFAVDALQAGQQDAKTFSNQMVKWADAVNKAFGDVWNAIGAVSYNGPVDDTVYLNCYEYLTDYLSCTGS